jgi:tetratricopeptide (TPR) repeat protein
VQIAQFLSAVGRIALYKRDLARAEQCLEQARALALQIDPSRPWGGTSFLGSVAFYQGDLERAARLYTEFLGGARRVGNRLLTGWMLTDLGMVAHARGDVEEAADYYRQAILPYRAIGYLEGVSEVFQRLAKVAAASRDFDHAARMMGAASALPYTVGSLEPPFEHATYDRCVEEVGAVLGDAAFTVAFTAGRGLPLEDAIDCALAAATDP